MQIGIPEIEETAENILALDPEAVVRFRLLRDVLRIPAGDKELDAARRDLERSRWIQELAFEQHPDGGWGAFHSRDTRLKQRIPSTEFAVERALSLGLESDHPILAKASGYIQDIFQGRIPFPDQGEKNDRWPTGMRLFLASTLAHIEPSHLLLEQGRELWIEIAKRTFQSGEYSQTDEIQAHTELTGATVKGSYLHLNGRYQLFLIGSLRGSLPHTIESALLAWLWQNPKGIGYLGVPVNGLPPYQHPGIFERWLTSHELLVCLFPAWIGLARQSMAWIWAQRNSQGYWDFGARPAYSTFMPLSDSWKIRRNRMFDWTTRFLILVRRFCD